MLLKQKPSSVEEKEIASHGLPRRKFLGKLGLTAGVTALAVACQKSVNPTDKALNSSSSSNAVNYGEGDIAILNYAYLLEQLEAAFYTKVIDNFYTGAASDWEKKRLAQVRDHEIAHREFFKTALGDAAIPEFEFDFSSIDFTNRTSVLSSAISFEDLGVSAYNGVASLIENADYLLVVGKIVSVEARHAGYVRDLLDPGSFADKTVVD